MKKTIIALALTLVLLASICTATADFIIMADSEFITATTNLTSTKTAYFDATTYYNKSSIKVTICVLEQKVDGVWKTAKTLTAPSTNATNTNAYSSSKSYSSDIGTGTFRISTTWNADGHIITRYSNEKIY